jgi:hypothetical protein
MELARHPNFFSATIHLCCSSVEQINNNESLIIMSNKKGTNTLKT